MLDNGKTLVTAQAKAEDSGHCHSGLSSYKLC